MDEHLHTMLRRALVAGLAIRMRLDEEGDEPVLHLRLIEPLGETSWAANVSPDGGIEGALLTLVTSCTQRIVDIGERQAVHSGQHGRRLPMGPGFGGS